MQHGLSDVLKDVTSIIAYFGQELEALRVFEYFFSEVSSKVVGDSVSVEFVDDLDLPIQFLDVLGAIVLGDLDVGISIYDELTPML